MNGFPATLDLINTRSTMRFAATLMLTAFLSYPTLAQPPLVANGPEPRDGVFTLQLEEAWRAGGSDDEESFFGLITWAEMGPGGLIYVLDGQLCQVNVYDTEGNLVRTLFHEGEGPGEIRQPRDLVVLADGSIGAVQEFPGRIIRVDSAGNPQPGIVPRLGDTADGGLVAMVTADQRAGTLAIACVQIAIDTERGGQHRNYYLGLVNDEGRVEKTLLQQTVDWDFSRFVYDEELNLPSFAFANAVGPRGRVVAASRRNEYRLEVFAADGTPELVITREYQSRKRDPEDIQWVHDLLDAAFSQVPFDYELKVSSTDADLHWLGRALQVDGEGNIWALSSRGIRNQPADILATFDVFDDQGVFTRQVQVACPGRGHEDGIFLLGPDHVLVVKGHVDATATLFGGAPAAEDEEAAPMEIICYRVRGLVRAP